MKKRARKKSNGPSKLERKFLIMGLTETYPTETIAKTQRAITAL